MSNNYHKSVSDPLQPKAQAPTQNQSVSVVDIAKSAGSSLKSMGKTLFGNLKKGPLK